VFWGVETTAPAREGKSLSGKSLKKSSGARGYCWAITAPTPGKKKNQEREESHPHEGFNGGNKGANNGNRP